MGFGPRSSPLTLPKRMSFGLLGATGGTAFCFAAVESAWTRSLNRDVAAAAPRARRLAIMAIFDLDGLESLGELTTCSQGFRVRGAPEPLPSQRYGPKRYY